MLNLERLKTERIARGLTKKEFARRMGWKSATSYANRENGFVDIGVDEFTTMVKILGYTQEDIKIFLKL